ncbi:MAG: Nif3-like dinuclear metal center hexameric protein, partial [Planctomycetota bacterium]
MTLADLLDTLETIAPLHAAEEWDNVGLLVGDASRADETPLDGPVLLTIDCTEAVAREAVEAGASVIVSY